MSFPTKWNAIKLPRLLTVTTIDGSMDINLGSAIAARGSRGGGRRLCVCVCWYVEKNNYTSVAMRGNKFPCTAALMAVDLRLIGHIVSTQWCFHSRSPLLLLLLLLLHSVLHARGNTLHVIMCRNRPSSLPISWLNCLHQERRGKGGLPSIPSHPTPSRPSSSMKCNSDNLVIWNIPTKPTANVQPSKRIMWQTSGIATHYAYTRSTEFRVINCI